jgi:HD-GYP domain-containing protein (c-di-GMP phosphodiesterase class II)
MMTNHSVNDDVYENYVDVAFFDIVLCVSRALDLLTPAFSDHHLRVAYVGARLADELRLEQRAAQDVIIGGALHDIGAVSPATRFSLPDFASSGLILDHDGNRQSVHQHGWEGYRLLGDFPPFANAARAICFHHVGWNFGEGNTFQGNAVPLASHILQLADRISVLPDPKRDILEQATDIRRTILDASGRVFHPQQVEAFEAVASSEAFWLDLTSDYKEEIIRAHFGDRNVNLSIDELHDLARVFGRMIDYRSPFTATHSSAVAVIAELIAELAGMPLRERKLIGVAGYLHDLGKLAVPSEILDKPGRLTPQEMLVIKQHPYHTHRLLSSVPGLEEVNTFASLHHERIDGTGFPFRVRQIPLGARVIAVADVFTALAEKRPYRDSLTIAESVEILDKLVADGAIDGEIVALVKASIAMLRERHDSLADSPEPQDCVAKFR